MLMDPHPSQQDVDLQYAVWQPQQEVTRLKAMFKPTSPKKSGGEIFLQAIPGFFFVYFRSFQANIITIFTKINVKMSIQYTVLGIEPTTFRTWASSHNH